LRKKDFFELEISRKKREEEKKEERKKERKNERKKEERRAEVHTCSEIFGAAMNIGVGAGGYQKTSL